MIKKTLEEYRRDREGYIYVLEFTSGTVKVGRTNNRDKRLAEHSKAAGQHGVTVLKTWVSETHKNYLENETALIDYCASRWAPTSGKEYFAAANFDEVVTYACGLPLKHWTQAEIDETQERVATAPSFVRAVITISEAIARRAEDERAAADDDEEEDFVLLEDVAPYDFVETVTAASAAKRHAAEALINHDLRLKLDPFAETQDWKSALHTARHGYEISLLLRTLRLHAGDAIADEVARTMWAASHENCHEYRDELAAWATADGTDLDVLAEMTRASYEQIQKFNARYRRPRSGQPAPAGAEGERPLEGGA